MKFELIFSFPGLFALASRPAPAIPGPGPNYARFPLLRFLVLATYPATVPSRHNEPRCRPDPAQCPALPHFVALAGS